MAPAMLQPSSSVWHAAKETKKDYEGPYVRPSNLATTSYASKAI